MAKGAKISPLVEQKQAALDRAFVRVVREHAQAGVPVILGEEGHAIERSLDELFNDVTQEEYAGDSKSLA